MFSLNKNSIGKAIAYTTTTRLHLSVHSTAPPAHCQAGQPMSSVGDTFTQGTRLRKGHSSL